MSAKPENGGTDWTDPDDAPELDDTFFEHGAYEVGGKPAPRAGRLGRPKAESPKVHTGLRLDVDVLAHFKAGGRGWQTRINAALREAMQKAR